MYTPRTNSEHRPEVLADFIRAHPFAALISAGPAGDISATHLPIVFDPTGGPHGRIEGHLARANPHHDVLRDNAGDGRSARESLLIFTGPDAYITPSWYPSKRVDGRTVPTWNYVAVHAYGTITVHDDPLWLRAHVGRLTDQSEAGRPNPWYVSDAPDDYVSRELRAIVGFEMAVTRFEARWKMSQNRSDEDIDGVVEGLGASDQAMDRVVAGIVEARRPNRSEDRRR